MRATTPSGGVPDGPLFLSMQAAVASGAGALFSTPAVVAGVGRSFYDPRQIDSNTWAGYWSPAGSPGRMSGVTVWVGGANYPTTRTDVTVP